MGAATRVYFDRVVKIGEQGLSKIDIAPTERTTETDRGLELELHPIAKNHEPDTTRTLRLFVPWARVNQIVRPSLPGSKLPRVERDPGPLTRAQALDTISMLDAQARDESRRRGRA
jgi:hypothetical protein